MLRMHPCAHAGRRSLRSLALGAALLATAMAGLAEPVEAQFTAAVTQPRRRAVGVRETLAAGPSADTVRTTQLSDLQAWVDSAATVLGSTPATRPAAPRDSAATPRDTLPPGRPSRATPARPPRSPPR